MAVSEVGKFLRKIRIDLDENLKDMAEKFDFAPSYLSSIENAKREVPKNFYAKVVENYALTYEQKQELYESIQKTKSVFEIAIDDNMDKQNVLIRMSNNKVSNEQYAKFLQILKEEEEE